MELIKTGFLLFYGIVRGLPFAVSTYFVLSTKRVDKSAESLWNLIHKVILLFVGVGANAIAFIGMHRYHYNDFEIVGYIKNVWGLNFFYHDVEYFAVSGVVAIILSLIVGFVLRAFIGAENFWNITKHQQYVVMASGFVAFCLLLLGLESKGYYNSHIQLNEVCSNNTSYTIDETGAVEDYVELFNSGILPCKISGLYLSDDKHNLQKLSLEGKIILAGEVLTVPCKGEVNSFAIDNQEEIVYLSDSNGNILEQIKVAGLEKNTSLSKVEDNKWEVGKSSPGKNNMESGEEYQVAQPVLSHSSGFYKDAFDLEITGAEGTAIYYTLDGSVPDEGSYLYEEAIRVYDRSAEPNKWRSLQNVVPEWQDYTPDTTPVDKAFLIRAIAVDSEGNKSKEVIATYFVDKEQYEGKKVLSLIADPYDLFSDEIGIYVTGKRYDEWYLNGQEGSEPTPLFKSDGEERRANLEIFDATESILQQNVGISIQGASAREGKDKRFSVCAREEYCGTELLGVTVQGREEQPHSVLIRESLADLLLQRLMEDRDIPIQLGEPICLFLNGEFWYGNRFLREKYNARYFEDYYGIDSDNLIVCKNSYINKGVETDILFYDDLYSYIEEHDLADAEAYNHFCEMVDIANYIDFLSANIYCANMDVSDVKNVVMWRSREATDDKYSDGKWRWALFDMDAIEWTSLNYYEVDEIAAIDSFSQKPRYASYPYNQSPIYMAVRKNADFCKRFVLTFMDLMNTNFSVESTEKLLKEYGKDITWMGSFFEKRPAYMKEYLAKEFELTGSVGTVTITNETVGGGLVTINSITPEMKNGSWSGEYFTDYSITVTAKPMEGYEFVGWSGDLISKDRTIEVPVEEGGIVLKAEFQKVK